MRGKLFRKPAYYQWITLAIVACLVLFMLYAFPAEWADTPRALHFIDVMSSLVPVIQLFRQHSNYSNFWGMFFSIFWVVSPLFLFLGFLFAFFQSGERYKYLIAMSGLKMFFLALVWLALNLFVWYLPMAGEGSWRMNQISRNPLFLTWSWLLVAGVIFGLGALIEMFLIKFFSKKIGE